MAFDVDPETVAALGASCLGLPDVGEEEAWAGLRWRVRGRTFAQVLRIVDGRPPSYASAAGTNGPAVTLTFQITDTERDLFERLGPPYWAIRWGRDVGGLLLGEDPDWGEIAELVTDSYCLLAPRKLAAQVVRPGASNPISGPG